MKNLGM